MSYPGEVGTYLAFYYDEDETEFAPVLAVGKAPSLDIHQTFIMGDDYLGQPADPHQIVERDEAEQAEPIDTKTNL